MKDGPDISKTAAMMGDPARSNMLMALMSGMSLTSAELAREAGVTPSTASGHLTQLESSGLVTSRKQGRHRYFKLADADVAHAVEALVTIAARAGHLRSRRVQRTMPCARPEPATTTSQAGSRSICSSAGFRQAYCDGRAMKSVCHHQAGQSSA
jgi:DNA-binding transcriptional ArsR family regulator